MMVFIKILFVVYLSLWHKLLRIGFRLLYNEFAWTYDLVSWVVSLGAWRDWQLAALPFVDGPSVLEIAHGPGHMLLALKRAGFEVMGLDLSAHMSQQAQRRLQKANTPLSLLRGTAQALPLTDKTFDTVLTTFPTDFVLETETLTAVQRVLKPNGRFVIVPSGYLTGNSFIHRCIEWLYAITGQRQTAVDQTMTDNQWESFSHRFVAAGFSVSIHNITLENSVATVIVAQK